MGEPSVLAGVAGVAEGEPMKAAFHLALTFGFMAMAGAVWFGDWEPSRFLVGGALASVALGSFADFLGELEP